MFKDTGNGHTNFCLNCELLQRKFNDYKDVKEFEIARYEQCLDEIDKIVKYSLDACHACNSAYACMRCDKGKILQKIKEVKEE